MKELLKQTLANLPQTPYSKGGDIFMEGKPDMPPANSQPTNPEHTEKAPQAPKIGVERPVSAERQNAARKAWGEFDRLFNRDEVLSVDQKRVREQIIEKGLPPIAGGTTGVPPGGREPPPAPPVTPSEEPDNQENGEASREELQDQARRVLEDLVRGQASLTNIGVGTTNESLIEQINAVKSVFSTNPQDRVGELRKAIERISLLQRVPTEEEDATTRGQNDIIFTSEKNNVVARLTILAENVRRAIGVLESRESSPGIFGERKLSEDEKERIRNAKTDSAVSYTHLTLPTTPYV